MVTEFSAGFSPNAGLGSITAARGYLWATELNTKSLARISTGGRVAEYGLPAALPSDVATMQANGKLWITDYSGNGIVEVTP